MMHFSIPVSCSVKMNTRIENSTPCIFNYEGKTTFAVRNDDELLMITQVVSGDGVEDIYVPVKNPENILELDPYANESELKEKGLTGHSLQFAKTYLSKYNVYHRRNEIAEAGGIKAIVNALRTHEKNAGVQKNACKAIASIAQNTNNREAFKEQGVVPLLIKAYNMGGEVMTCAMSALIALGEIEQLLLSEISNHATISPFFNNASTTASVTAVMQSCMTPCNVGPTKHYCNACKKDCPKSEFSITQWKKGASRRCTACIKLS